MDLLPKNVKKVIVNADDFGQVTSVNEAIIACHKAGIVKSASILANGEGLREALEEAKINPNLGLGIHLALVFGKPVAKPEKIPSLMFANGGFAHKYPMFTLRYFTGGINLKEVEYEWECQRSLLDNIEIDHIDSHQHLHLLPALFKLTLKLALKWKIPYIRVPQENISSSVKSTKALPAKVLNFYSLGKKKALDSTGLKTTEHFFGTSFSGGMLKPVWENIWDKIPSGVTEIMCHPGIENIYARHNYGWANSWHAEYEALTSPEILRKALQKDIVFTNFSELADSNGQIHSMAE